MRKYEDAWDYEVKPSRWWVAALIALVGAVALAR